MLPVTGTAKAESPAPRVWVKSGTVATRLTGSAPAPIVVVGPGPFTTLVYTVAEPHSTFPPNTATLWRSPPRLASSLSFSSSAASSSPTASSNLAPDNPGLRAA